MIAIPGGWPPAGGVLRAQPQAQTVRQIRIDSNQAKLEGGVILADTCRRCQAALAAIKKVTPPSLSLSPAVALISPESVAVAASGLAHFGFLTWLTCFFFGAWQLTLNSGSVWVVSRIIAINFYI